MTLFNHGSSRKKGKPPQFKKGLGSRLRGLFKRKPSSGQSDGRLSHRLGIMFARSIIVLLVGVAWWVLAPQLFLVLLPSFTYYNTLILSNPGVTANDVYQFWQVVPEVLLFMFAFLWTGGIIEMLLHKEPLVTVFPF